MGGQETGGSGVATTADASGVETGSRSDAAMIVDSSVIDAADAFTRDASVAGDASVASDRSVVTNRYDNVRSGVTLTETALTTANVNSAQFGLLFSRAVDGQIYAQPLYLGGLTMPDGKLHNVVFVATAHNSVYAFDADDRAASAPLWQKNLGPSGSTTVFGCTDMTPEVGIISTPVIDRQAGILYVVSKGQENGAWVQRLHALDVTTGAERTGSPAVIAASVAGSGAGANGGMVAFNPQTQLNRPGLLLEAATLYLAFASHCDFGPYHGWVLAYRYDGTRFQATAQFNVSPNGSEGGIWQAGVGLSTDGESLYFSAGNGSTNPNATPPDLSESVVRLGLSNFAVADYWTPSSFSALNAADSDLSSGAILLPHNLLLTGSKDGRLYLLDRANLGKFSASTDTILQTVTTPGKSSGLRGHLHGGAIDYQDAGGNEWVLVWPESSPLMRFALNPTTRRLENPMVAAIAMPGHPGGIMSLSANGTRAGTPVLWASMPSGSDQDGARHMAVPGTLYAVDPSATPPRMLWSSDQTPARDTVGNVAKFNTPTVAGGHVYLGTFSNALRVYGLL